MRKYIIVVILMLFSQHCYYSQLDQKELSRIHGHWVGSGRFYNIKFNQEYGPLGFDIIIDSLNIVQGLIGDATIETRKIIKTKDRIDILCTIRGKIHKDLKCKKDHVVFLLVDIGDNKIEGDFHLKNNFVFDFTMAPGEFVLHRKRKS